MKALFILNPNAGNRRDSEAIESMVDAACRRASWPYRIGHSPSVDTLDEILREALRDQTECVFGIGGDGTISAIASRIAGSPLALGIIPRGSGNGLARHLRIPMDPAAALEASLHGRPEMIDTGTVNGRRFVAFCGLGFDAAVADRFARLEGRGFLNYLRAGLSTFGAYEPETYQMITEATTVDLTAFILLVANANQYGNEAMVAPLASLTDGKFEVCAISRPRLVDVPFHLRRLFLGTFDRASCYSPVRAESRFTIIRKARGMINLDGEPVEMDAGLEIEMHPASLRLLVPMNAHL